jgi:uncharacterized protein YbcI
MSKADLSKAQRIAQATRAFEQRTTGWLPSSLTVVLDGHTLVIMLHGTFSPAEMALAKSREGAAQLREFHRQLFTTVAEPLRQEIGRITEVEVREATAEVETSTGTVVQVFSLAHTVPADSWSGSDPGLAEADRESTGGAMPTTE